MKMPAVKTSLFLLLAALTSACTENIEPVSSQIDPKVFTEHPIASRDSPSLQLYPTEFTTLEGWDDDNHVAAYQSFRRSCDYWRRQSDGKPMKGVFELGRVGDWKRLCNVRVGAGQEKLFFERWFKPYAVNSNGSFNGLFTGYYIPLLRGSYTRSERYNVPIYRKPSSSRLRRLTRTQIYNGGLKNKGLELLWVDSLIDAYFMEVQGSGRVLMDDGSLQGVSYAGKNGHGYFAIGKALVDSGEIAREDISMQTIRDWLQKHPEAGLRLMQKNRSYVYFRLTKVKPSEGAVGAMGQPLTAKRSLAVDRRHLPLGIPIWLDAQHPVDEDQRITNLVMAQDTGGAIKGAIRGDFYWGEGHQAGEMAGPMKSSGRYYLLLPRSLYVGRVHSGI